MDITLSIVNRTSEQLEKLIQEISNSNMAKPVQYDLMDVLQTIKEQNLQAKEMGWL